MTGEMSWIKPNGEDSNGDSYPVHAQVARALRCQLRPFDVYIGPYIATKEGKLFIGSDDGVMANVCLWVGGIAPAYREPIVIDFGCVGDVDAAIKAARQALRLARKQRKAA